MNSSIKRNNYIIEFIGFILLIVIWALVSSIINNDLILPTPLDVFYSCTKILSQGKTYLVILFTLLRILISLAIGFTFGIFLGFLSYFNKWLYRLLNPLIKVLRALPIASIILIILFMFGPKDNMYISVPPILVSILLIVPLVFESVYQGLKNIDQDYINVGLIYLEKKDMIGKCYLPLIKKDINTSISQSIGLSFKSMVMAEYITQERMSIGSSLLEAKINLETSYVFGWTIILIILAIIIELIATSINKLK